MIKMNLMSEPDQYKWMRKNIVKVRLTGTYSA